MDDASVETVLVGQVGPVLTEVEVEEAPEGRQLVVITHIVQEKHPGEGLLDVDSAYGLTFV
jgi:hypothetical protein